MVRTLFQNGTAHRVWCSDNVDLVFVIHGIQHVHVTHAHSLHLESQAWPTDPTAIRTPLSSPGRSAVYANTHPYLGESGTTAKRAQWIEALDKIAAVGPEHVVGGHSDPSKGFGAGSVQETKSYLQNVDRISAEVGTAEELYNRILEIYPGRFNPGSLWAGAILIYKQT